MLDILKQKLEKNDVVGAAHMFHDWHPITLSNLLLAVQAARTLHSMNSRWPEYERAVAALAYHEGISMVNFRGVDVPYPEAALSVIEMAVDFNRDEQADSPYDELEPPWDYVDLSDAWGL